MPDVVHGSERRPLEPGRLLFDDAAELSVVVPASCRKTGRCHECVVEVRAGGDQLSAADGRGVIPGPVVPARLPGGRGARGARRRVRGAAPPPADPAGARRRPTRCRSWTPRCASWTAASSRTTAPTSAPASAPTWVRPTARPSGSPSTSAPPPSSSSWSTSVRGAVLAVAAIENPQRFGGSDVMTRISYDTEVPGELRQALRRALNHELRRLCSELGVDRRAAGGRPGRRQPDDAGPRLRPGRASARTPCRTAP